MEDQVNPAREAQGLAPIPIHASANLYDILVSKRYHATP